MSKWALKVITQSSWPWAVLWRKIRMCRFIFDFYLMLCYHTIHLSQSHSSGIGFVDDALISWSILSLSVIIKTKYWCVLLHIQYLVQRCRKVESTVFKMDLTFHLLSSPFPRKIIWETHNSEGPAQSNSQWSSPSVLTKSLILIFTFVTWCWNI